MKPAYAAILFVTAFLAVLACLYSCEKDEEEDGKRNYLQIEEKTYNLDKGVIEYYGRLSERESGHNYDLILVSEGIDLQKESGKGSMVYFELFAASSGQLDSGDYTFDNKATEAPNTFDMGLFAHDYDYAAESGPLGYFKGGKISVVAENGEDYEFNFEGTGVDGVKIQGHFKGTLKVLDYSQKSAVKSKFLKP